MTQSRHDSGGEAVPIGGIPSWLGPWKEVVYNGRPMDAAEPPPWHQDGYGVSGEATDEELALIRVFGVALILLLIIVGMALSQYVICLFACSETLSFL
jgi:hypothetical protein